MFTDSDGALSSAEVFVRLAWAESDSEPFGWPSEGCSGFHGSPTDGDFSGTLPNFPSFVTDGNANPEVIGGPREGEPDEDAFNLEGTKAKVFFNDPLFGIDGRTACGDLSGDEELSLDVKVSPNISSNISRSWLTAFATTLALKRLPDFNNSISNLNLSSIATSTAQTTLFQNKGITSDACLWSSLLSQLLGRWRHPRWLFGKVACSERDLRQELTCSQYSDVNASFRSVWRMSCSDRLLD